VHARKTDTKNKGYRKTTQIENGAARKAAEKGVLVEGITERRSKETRIFRKVYLPRVACV